MKKILSTDKLYVAQSKIDSAGRGVFARIAMKKGAIIERCPVLEIPEYEGPNINQTILITYIYYLGKKKERLMLALGFGSIYNHSETPNAIYSEKYKEETINFIAINDIQKDEEITVNYNPKKQKNKKPLWLEITN